MKKLLIPIIVLLAVAVAVAFFIGSENKQSPTQTDNKEVVDSEQDRREYSNVSLPALMNKEYDGRDLTIGRVLDDNEAYVRYFITYKSGDLTISGIMNVPKGEGPFPVLFLNHGYIDPAVYTNGRGLRREQDYLARRGYVAIHPDYRNHAQSDKDPDTDYNFRLGYVEDVINAVYAVKNSDLKFLDKERIGMLGHSMGGGVAINIMVVKPGLVKAYVLFAPVSADYSDNFARWLERRPEVAERIIESYGRPGDNPDFWKNISAINFLDKVESPVMIHHGTADESVPLEWSDRLNLGLKDAGKEVTYHVYESQPHEFTTSWGQVMQRTVDFFNTNVK